MLDKVTKLPELDNQVMGIFINIQRAVNSSNKFGNLFIQLLVVELSDNDLKKLARYVAANTKDVEKAGEKNYAFYIANMFNINEPDKLDEDDTSSWCCLVTLAILQSTINYYLFQMASTELTGP